MSSRREFITLLGAAATTWPLAARAQQRERMRRIGVLIVYPQADREGQVRIAAFLDTLQRLGWTDGRNVRVDYRWSVSDPAREKAAAAELVRSTPDVIVTSGPTMLAEVQRPQAGSLSLALDAADTIQAQDGLEKMLVHQMAVLHYGMMRAAARG